MISIGRVLFWPSRNMEVALQRLPAIVCLLSMLCGVAWQQELDPPTFATTPPPLVEFSNMTGARIPCAASAHQFPSNSSWLGVDGSPLTSIPGLREILRDGTLVLPPFKAQHFRQDVHATSYKCALTNSIGTVVSNDVNIKAVVLQPYDVYVYDVFTMGGSTAVMKCHVPKMISTHVTVTSWIKDSTETISALDLGKDSRFAVIPSGELYIKNVTTNDGRGTFDCVIANKLTGEAKKSITSGKLFVTEPQGNVPPKITFSKKVILAKEGETALLPCEAQAHPLPSVRWFRSSDGDRSNDIAINGRLSLLSGSLLIKNVLKTDSGKYTCTTSNVAGSEKVEVQLIIQAPLLVTIDPPSLTVDNGKAVILSCKTNASPKNTITWIKDGRPLIAMPSIEMLSNSSFRINSVSSEHKGIYQCLVKSPYEEAFAVSVLKLGDMSPVLVSGFKENTLQPGNSVNLQCIFFGSPTPEITWFVEDQTVSSASVREESVNADENVVSVLSLRNMKIEDGGMYSCRAENKAGKATHSSRVNVYGELGSRQLSKITAVNGQTVVLNCPFYGFPFGRVKWEKDGQNLPNNLNQRLTQNYNLRIKQVHKTSDSGIYTCSVTHATRTIRSEVQLIVMVPPKLAPFSFQDELVREGMRGRLQCVVLEGDTPLTLKWLKDGNPISPSLGVNVRDIDEFSSILTIASIAPRNNGNYTCVAKNPAAEVTFTTLLAVNGNAFFGYCFSSSTNFAVCFPR